MIKKCSYSDLIFQFWHEHFRPSRFATRIITAASNEHPGRRSTRLIAVTLCVVADTDALIGRVGRLIASFALTFLSKLSRQFLDVCATEFKSFVNVLVEDQVLEADEDHSQDDGQLQGIALRELQVKKT